MQTIEKVLLKRSTKRGVIGYESIYKFDCEAQNQDHLISLGSKDGAILLFLDILSPSSRVDYIRSYYRKDQFRATIDYNIRSSRLAGKQNITSAMHDYSVIEFKYSADLDEQFRSIYRIFSDIAIRNTKSSKYSNSLMY